MDCLVLKVILIHGYLKSWKPCIVSDIEDLGSARKRARNINNLSRSFVANG